MSRPSTRNTRCRRPPRRGVIVLVFVLMISLAMAFSFAMLRWQGTSVAVASNHLRHARARTAAETGLALGFQRMHDSGEWGGTGSSFAVTLNDTDSVLVSYIVGDPRLSDTDDDWEMYAFRVTIQATGTSLDLLHPTVASNEVLEMVVELVPEQLSDEPTNWTDFEPYTLWQAEQETVTIELPSRIEGPVRLQGELLIAQAAPNTNDSRNQYLSDLEAMRLGGLGDHRTFEGPVHLDTSEAGSGLARLALMNVTTVNIPEEGPAADWQFPAGVSTYRIYESGPTYTIPMLSGTLSGVSLEPDPLTNPLGVYACSGSVELGNNATIRGTLMCANDLKIDGTNVVLETPDLPPLQGSSAPVHLPLISCKDLVLEQDVSVSMTGLLAVFGEMEAASSAGHPPIAIEGKLVLSEQLTVEERPEWTAVNWGLWYFVFGLNGGTGNLGYFPYLVSLPPLNLPYQGVFTLKPPSTPVEFHWSANFTNPVYVPKTGADGLRWDIVWRD